MWEERLAREKTGAMGLTSGPRVLVGAGEKSQAREEWEGEAGDPPAVV